MRPAAIVWPDVEAHLTTYLKTTLPTHGHGSTWVGNHLPTTIPAEAVLIRDDGGPALGDVRALARVGFRVWSGRQIQNPGDSFDLASLCAALIGGCADGDPVVRAQITSRPFSIEDPSERPVHYFTAELVVRGTDL